MAVTATPPGRELENGIVFCRVDRWLTGRCLVSLPFSDHCNALIANRAELQYLLGQLQNHLKSDGLKYCELRPASASLPDSNPFAEWRPAGEYVLHTLDLRRELDELKAGFHKNCVLRKIRSAEQNHLVCEEGREESHLAKFYQLQLRTRRRHHLPTQPFSWFRILAESMGERLTVRIASLERRPVAAILTLAHKHTVVYKYGASDERYHRLGGTQLLLWKAIQDAKSRGALEFDFGRSDHDNPGLAVFKDRWGAVRRPLTYYRSHEEREVAEKGIRMARRIALRLPGWMVARMGRYVYRHFA